MKEKSPVSEEDYSYYINENGKKDKEAKRRIGGKIYCEKVISHSQKLFELILFDAPSRFIQNEARSLAEAMAINCFGE